MILLRAIVLSIALAACGEQKPEAPAASQAPTVTLQPPPADAAAPPTTANYDAEILVWARSVYNVDGANLIEPIETFYGDFTGDGAPDALVFAYHDTGGSSAALNVSLFRNVDGHMQYLRNVDEVLGMTPRDAQFARGRITVTTSVPGPHDPLCCPTRAHEWVILTR